VFCGPCKDWRDYTSQKQLLPTQHHIRYSVTIAISESSTTLFERLRTMSKTPCKPMPKSPVKNVTSGGKLGKGK
jgi:hypothetical protein